MWGRRLGRMLLVMSVFLGAVTVVEVWSAGRTPVAKADDITPPPTPPPPDPPIVGFIDTHLHQFGNEGFGGLEMWGSPMDPLLDPTASDSVGAARALPPSDYLFVSDTAV